MLAGHVGVGLAFARVERRVNAGVFVGAALLLDLVLWPLVLIGWESVRIPPDFASTHQAHFVFPSSHGLLAAALWSGAATGLAYAAWPRLQAARKRAAALVGGAVFSHWLLDALVHRPELPILGGGAGAAQLGLGLWHSLPLALAVEAALVAVGLWAYLRGYASPRWLRGAWIALALLLMLFTAAGMTLAPPPPSAQAMAASSELTLLVVCALAAWLARRHD